MFHIILVTPVLANYTWINPENLILEIWPDAWKSFHAAQVLLCFFKQSGSWLTAVILHIGDMLEYICTSSPVPSYLSFLPSPSLQCTVVGWRAITQADGSASQQASCDGCDTTRHSMTCTAGWHTYMEWEIEILQKHDSILANDPQVFLLSVWTPLVFSVYEARSHFRCCSQTWWEFW